MNKFRSNCCGELTEKNIGQNVHLSGWIHRKRDHGNLLFIDLRDHYGITQCVIENNNKNFSLIEKVSPESVITCYGKVSKRVSGTENKDLLTGKIEIKIEKITILSSAKELPLPVFGEQDYPEDIRLKYRFLDLRRKEMHHKIELRSHVISFIRKKMIENGFLEFQTPILTASSPEGARDFLVPSRLNPGKFFALPQAPQQFKQMIMISGFDKYFQIAPCFRDEDGRADRSPGEHYQLDLEMSFVEQEDIFQIMEPIFVSLFKKFGNNKEVSEAPFKKLSYNESLRLYGTDKPDLRNPITISDVTDIIKTKDVTLEIFKKNVKKNGAVKAIPVPNTKGKARSFFDELNEWAKKEGMGGLAYLTFEKLNNSINPKGPISKFFSKSAIEKIMDLCGIKEEGAVFFVSDNQENATKYAGMARQKIAKELKLINEKEFKFCWVVDFPMYQYNEEEKKLDFSHNPFSMPQVDMKEFDKTDPLKILAYQYDLVCNGYELSSGAIRNHLPEFMFKVFKKVGYSKEEVEKKFSGMIKALSYGAPPHGGMAPGIDRIVMLLSGESNIREVTLFPMTQNAQDLLMGAPSEIDKKQLNELGLEIKRKTKY